MSKSHFFQEHAIDLNTNDICEKILETFDYSLLEEDMNIDYEKFPNELPNIDEHIKLLYEKYYSNLHHDGYNYNNSGVFYIQKILTITPKFLATLPWSKGIKPKKIISNALNIHIFLNDPGLCFEYFCPFNNDIVGIKCQPGKAAVYPNFWGSIFKHVTFDKNVLYINCIIGVLQ